jgi:hypothetical protein
MECLPKHCDMLSAVKMASTPSRRRILFVDGSCFYFELPRLRYAAFAVLEADGATVHSGHLAGRVQTVLRAELTAGVCLRHEGCGVC